MKTKKEKNELAESMRKDFLENGLTMVKIAEKNKITRERVRQILKIKYNLSSADGKVRKENIAKVQEKKSQSDLKFFNQHGMTKEKFNEIREKFGIVSFIDEGGEAKEKVRNVVYQAYINQKANAYRAKIGFHLSFAQWWKLWEESGKFAERGQGKYGLVRHDSDFAFTIENTAIGLSSERASAKMKEWWVKEKLAAAEA
jgi:hypothetical protein